MASMSSSSTVLGLRLHLGLRLWLGLDRGLGIVLVDRGAHSGRLGQNRLDLEADPGTDAVECEDIGG